MLPEMPDVAGEILKEFAGGLSELKTDAFIGLYLTGSIPLGDFHPDKSDIDFLVLCKELPKEELRFQVKQLHQQIEKKFRKPNLSGCYLTPNCLEVNYARTATTLCFDEGLLSEATFDMAPITLFELKTTAITIFGTPAQDLPVTITLQEVERFLFENINTYWKNWIDNGTMFTKNGLMLVLIPRITEWIILGVARQLYTLRTGEIISKTNAGYYCLQHLYGKYHAIIEKAIEIRKDKSKHIIGKDSYYIKPSLKRAGDTVRCARHITGIFNKEYNEKDRNS